MAERVLRVAGLLALVACAMLAPLPPVAGAAGSPAVRGFSPRSGWGGDAVTIFGSGFTSATNVRFDGEDASSFSVDSSSHIAATIPEGVWELSLGIYCTLKGFKPSSPILRAGAPVDRTAAMPAPA